MKKYFAREALLPQGWARDVGISVDKGDVVGVEVNSRGGETLAGPVLPGMANLHSHAFQRAMAGLTEMRGPAQDDFWTWRELMYRLVGQLSPEQIEVIARQLYIEMLKAVMGESAGIRRPGSAALDLSYVAAGRVDGFWELGLNIWDIAAGALPMFNMPFAPRRMTSTRRALID